MKLKRKIFSKNILIFLFYIFFASGVAFAQNGILSPDSEVSLERIDSTWKYENGDVVEWNDGSGNLVTEPWVVIVFDTSKAPITVTVSQTCYITNLIIYGDNECTFILNGCDFGINKLYLGSAYTIEGIDESYFDNANKKAGNLKIVGNGSSDNTFKVDSLIDTSSDNNGVANKITVNNTTFTNQSGWNLGNLEDGSLAPEIYGENGTINIGNLTGADDLKNELKSSIGEDGSVNVPEIIVPTEAIWEGTEDSSWDNPNNWNAGAVLDGSMPIIIDGSATNQPVIDSEKSFTFADDNKIAFINEATLTIETSGTLTIDSEKFDFQSDSSKITVNGTLELENSSTIDSHFDSNSTGTISCVDSVTSLIITQVFTNLNTIEVSNGELTVYQNFTCDQIEAKTVEFKNGMEISCNSINAESLTNGGDFTVNSELQVSSITNQHKLTIADSVTVINQLSSILNDAELILNVDTVIEEVTNNQNGKITVATGKYLEVKKQFSNTGIFTGSIKFTGDNISSGNNSLGDANSKYTELFINTSTPIQFGGQAVIRTLRVENAESVKFFSAVTINEIDDNGFKGDFYFDATKFDQNTGGLSTSEGFKFNTSGVVYIGKDSNSQISFVNAASPVNFTHTAGKTTIAGNVVANEITLAENTIDGTITGTEITLGKTTLNGNITGTDVEIGELSLAGTIIGNNITLAEKNVVEDSELKINETSTDGKITLNGNITSSDSKNLTLNGNVDAQCSSINLNQGTLESKGTFTAQNDLLINAICTFENYVDAKGNLTINGTSTFNQTVEVGKNLTINGNANFANTVTTGNNLTITGDEININGAVIAGKSDPFTEGSILLTGITKITANSLTATKDITLNANVIETAALNATNNIFINKDSEVLEQTLNITGDVSSNNFEAVAKIQTFDGTISVDNDFSCKGTQLDFAKAVTVKNMTFSGDEITFADKVTVNQNAQIQNTGLLKISDFVYGKSFVQKGSESKTGQVMISGSFEQSGESENPTATFGSNVYFYNSSQNSLDITIGSEKSSIIIDGNLIIAKSKENDVAIKGTVKSKNFALYSGNVDLSGDLEIGEDVVILGENYSLKDDQTGIENLYSYTENRPAHWSQASYTFETSLPDETEISQNYAGTVKVAQDKSITVGKNLYANGTVFALSGALGSGKWKLNVPDTSDAANSFCEVYYSEVSDCVAAYQIAALECKDKSGNINWAFDDETGTVKITKAYSVSDNVIRVEFNKPVRILKDRFTQKQMRFSNGPDENHYFENVYLDEKCTKEASEVVNQYYEENGSKNYFVYVKANSKWNTDATGTFVGEEKSTDYDGVHQNTTICLDFPRAIVATTQSGQNFFSYIITDLWGKRLINYSERTTSGTHKTPYENVEDKTGPVLISVKTGQENHTEYDGTKGAQSQPSYDSHNFIEFVYSEFVNFGTEPAENVAENPDGAEEVFLKADDQGIENAKNIQVTQKFGALQNEDITQSGELKFAGLAKIQNGKIYTGSQNNQGNADKYVNALYRFDKYSLRYSIAGYTHPTEFVQDDQGNTHKKWIGYIQEAELPTGTVSMICDGKNDLVFDMAGNSQTLVKNNLTVDSSKSGVYGNWDISKPTFATLRANFQEEWQENTYFEAIGNNFGAGSTLDRIEFHFFDNTPNYNTTDPAVWVTERGWVVNDFTKEQLVLPDSYCADNFGGSRPFHAQKEFRTTGGLRFSSVQNISQSFLYTTNDTEEPSISFNNSMQTIIGANAKIFTGSSSTRRPTNNYDGLYISLMLQDTSLNVKTTFLVSYNNQNSYITDLAGNRLLSKTIHTIDRTSPSIGIILSPISQKDFYIVFVKKINQNSVKLVDNEENKIEIPETFLELLPQCFEIIKIQKDGTYTLSDIQIDTSVYATEIQLNDSENFTAFKMTLNREVTFEDIKSLHFKIKNPQKYDFLMTDPVTNIKDSYVTLIQDKLGNYIDINQCHAFSDVAINSVVPLYAYNSALNEVIEEDGKKKVNIFDGLYNEEHFAVRDWNKDQQNYGTLFSQQEISIVADFDSISKENAVKNKLKIYLSNSPDEESVSKAFNKNLCGSLRIWFPNVMENPISIFSVNNNQNFQTVSSTFVNNNNCADSLKFLLPLEMTNLWSAQDQVSFLFSYVNNDNSDLIIYPSPIFDIDKKVYDLQKSAKFPLFAIRMENPQDITTLDLWSFRLKNLTEQRGGVSILNNVINATYGEKAVVKVNVPQDSNVDVIVMTLDGNIVTYLQHGAISSGEHYFTWNGTNMSGTKVARGLYFVRVIGPNFDETRKVMVVKD